MNPFQFALTALYFLAAPRLPLIQEGDFPETPVAPATNPSIEELYQPGDESRWVFEQNGERIGDHRFLYRGMVELEGTPTHHFTGWLRVESATPLGKLEQLLQGDLWIDSDGRDLRQVLQVRVSDTYTRIEIDREQDRVSMKVTGSQERELESSISSDAFVQVNNFIGFFELFYRLKTPSRKHASEYTLYSSNALQEFKYSVEWKERFTLKMGELPVVGNVWSDSLGEQISIADDGRLMSIEVASQQLLIRRTDQELSLFTIEPPPTKPLGETLVGEEVKIAYGDVSLAGTVTRPESPAPASGFPAVFFISGSGTQDRQGSSGGVDLGTHEVLDRLVEEGFLTLRVDDRGVGGSTGPMEGIGFDELIADARACVDYLFARDDVDRRRIVLIGHSEGGATAPILAAERPEIAAVVLMAAIGRSMPDIIYEQNQQVLAKADLDQATREQILAEVRRFMDQVRSGAEIRATDYSAAYGPMIANLEWLRDHAAQDPQANIIKLTCPVLILQGVEDIQVSPERDAKALDDALALVGHEDHELHVFAGLDHLFKRTVGEESQLSDYALDRRVDEGFLSVLSAWLNQRLN